MTTQRFSSARLRSARRGRNADRRRVTLHELRARMVDSLGDDAPTVSTLHRWEQSLRAPRAYWDHLARALGVAVEDLTTAPRKETTR
jgi:hypothetical protein